MDYSNMLQRPLYRVGFYLAVGFMGLVWASCVARTGVEPAPEPPQELVIDRLAFLKMAEASRPAFDSVSDSMTFKAEKIYPNDQLGLSLYDKLPISMDKRIELKRVDGMGNIFILPMGNIKVGGLTTQEAERAVEKKMMEFVKSPYCEIVITEREAGRDAFYIFGEISKNGSLPLRGSNYRLLDAISDAGGVGSNAYRRSVKIIRPDGDKVRMISINLYDILAKGKLNDNVLLRSQDIVFVPRRFYAGFDEVTGLISKLVPWYYFVAAFTVPKN
jgi:protein involved in polysaccharide export with SLBB domain